MPMYLPYYRRVLVRGALFWCVLRVVLQVAAARLNAPLPLHPGAALGVIAFALAIETLHARAMREVVFRANAGIATTAVLLPLSGLLLVLELLWRGLL